PVLAISCGVTKTSALIREIKSLPHSRTSRVRMIDRKRGDSLSQSTTSAVAGAYSCKKTVWCPGGDREGATSQGMATKRVGASVIHRRWRTEWSSPSKSREKNRVCGKGVGAFPSKPKAHTKALREGGRLTSFLTPRERCRHSGNSRDAATNGSMLATTK